jgi:hypothetical protein
MHSYILLQQVPSIISLSEGNGTWCTEVIESYQYANFIFVYPADLSSSNRDLWRLLRHRGTGPDSFPTEPSLYGGEA